MSTRGPVTAAATEGVLHRCFAVDGLCSGVLSRALVLNLTFFCKVGGGINQIVV